MDNYNFEGGDEYGGADGSGGFTDTLRQSFKDKWFIGLSIYLLLIGILLTVLGLTAYKDKDSKDPAWGCVVPGILSIFIPVGLWILTWQ